VRAHEGRSQMAPPAIGCRWEARGGQTTVGGEPGSRYQIRGRPTSRLGAPYHWTSRPQSAQLIAARHSPSRGSSVRRPNMRPPQVHVSVHSVEARLVALSITASPRSATLDAETVRLEAFVDSPGVDA